MSSNNSHIILMKIKECYADYRLNKKTFMNMCELIFEWINSTNLNQVESMNELKRIIPIQFVALTATLKGAELKWRNQVCTYQLAFVLSASLDKYDQDRTIMAECKKYGLNYADGNQMKLNEEKLLNTGFITIATEFDELCRLNPNKQFEKAAEQDKKTK